MSTTPLVGELLPKAGKQVIDCELPSMAQHEQTALMLSLVKLGYNTQIRQTENCTVAVYAVKS